jgi:hypothetical protein
MIFFGGVVRRGMAAARSIKSRAWKKANNLNQA